MDYYNKILTQYENSTSLGLENGRCGLALLFFLLSEKNAGYEEKALMHLNYLLEHVYESSSLSFNKGLMGIGWTLEFLTQNQYIPNSNDNLLNEIDDIIYKWVNFYQLNSFSIQDGYLGALLYFCYRLKGDRIMIPYRELALKECTIRILGKLYIEIERQTNARLSETEWRQLHVLAGLFRRMNIQNHIVSDILRITQNMVKKEISSKPRKDNVTIINAIYSLIDTDTKHKVVKSFFAF